MLAVTELCGKLGLIGALDEGIGPVKQRQRGFTGGQVLTGMAAAQLAGEDFLVGLDRLPPAPAQPPPAHRPTPPPPRHQTPRKSTSPRARRDTGPLSCP